MKNILRYIIIFIIAVLILITLLVLSALIPKNKIINNLKASAEYFKGVRGVNRKTIAKEYETIHYYADSVLLNIILNIDSSKPVKSVLEAKYYEYIRVDTNDDFINAINNDYEANQQYLRYWHGNIIFIRPLLTIFSIKEIYAINKIIYVILLVLLMVLLFRRDKILSIVFLVSSCFLTTMYITPKCIEYFSTVFIMLIISIIAVLIEKKENKNLYSLFFVSGILTCFFDFLTTETLTILVPLTLVILIRYKERRLKDFKSEFLFLIKSLSLWGIAYVLMWITKWTLAAIILRINAFDYVKDNLMLRINWNGKQEIGYKMIKKTILLNLKVLYPLNCLKIKYIYMILTSIIGLAVLLQIINIRDKRNNWINYILAIIALIPYIRFIVLLNHSYNHYFFTFRAQLPSIMSLAFIIIINIKTIKIDNKHKRIILMHTLKLKKNKIKQKAKYN